jgi:HK97 family phage major capsid protein
MSLIDQLVTQRNQLHHEFELIVSAASRANRDDLLPGEKQVFTDLKALNDRIHHLEREEARAGDITGLSRRVHQPQGNTMSNRIDDRGLVYAKSSRNSWVRDLVRMQCGLDDNYESRTRLQQHSHEVQTHAAYVEYRDLSRVDGVGGYAVPPIWLVQQYIELARPGQVFANLLQQQNLISGTDSINIPKVLSGTAVGIQTADNATIADVDLTDTFINAPVRTIAGQEGVAIQLLDQSPIDFSDVIFKDLTAAHAVALDLQVLNGTGSSGQVLGLNNTAGINTIAIGSLTIQGIYSAIANAIQLIHTTRFLPPTAVVMHPRRWAWLLSLLDTTNRPLFLPEANNPYNAAGIQEGVVSQGRVGQVAGLPIFVDANISITSGSEYGSYGDEDEIIVGRFDDALLWQSGLRARVLPEVKAPSLTVVLQVYSYIAATFARYPQSFTTITGLAAPSF